MSQKFIKLKNNNRANVKAYGKYFATAVYDNHFVGTDEIADFIQRQASVKKSIGVEKAEDCGASTITTRRVLFQPETERVVVGQTKKSDGTVKQKYVTAISLLKDVIFEETHDNSMNVESEPSSNGGNQGEGD